MFFSPHPGWLNVLVTCCGTIDLPSQAVLMLFIQLKHVKPMETLKGQDDGRENYLAMLLCSLGKHLLLLAFVMEIIWEDIGRKNYIPVLLQVNVKFDKDMQ